RVLFRSDVAVQGVRRRVQLAVGIPAVQRGIRVVQRPGGAPGPVDGFGGLEPEPLPVLKAAAVILGVRTHSDQLRVAIESDGTVSPPSMPIVRLLARSVGWFASAPETMG